MIISILSLIHISNAINQDYYTDASLVDFIKELANAKELVKDLNTTQDDVDQQLTSLTNSMDSLVAYVAPNLDAIKDVYKRQLYTCFFN